MSNFVFRIAGVDVTDSVIIRDAVFTSAAKGAAGSADFRLRDEAHLYSFNTGDSLVLRVDGEIVWGGYVAKIERGYFFEADCRCKAHTFPRYLKVTGTDYNVLLNKRVLYDSGNPTDMELRRYAAGTYDDTILTYYLENYTDIAADGITLGMIERVGIPQTDDFFSGSPSWTINQFMQTLTSEQLGSIWYIDPEKHFVYTDVDTPNAAFGLSDDPGAGQVGYREAEFDFDGSGLVNDALAWGVGQGAQEPVFFRSQDSDSIDEHGLWQAGSFANNVWHQSTIQRIARSYVFGSPQNHRGGKDDRVSVKCSVFEPSFRVAQKVAVECETFGFNDVIPIRYQRITFPSHESVRFDLVLSHDIDEPWTTLEFWWPDWDLPDWKPPILQLPQPPTLPGSNPCRGQQGVPGNCIETFSRTDTTGLGVSEIGGGSWPINGRYSVDGDEAVISNTGPLTLGPGNAGSTVYTGLSGGFTAPMKLPLSFSTSPIEILMRLRMAHEGSSIHYFGNTESFARFQMILSNQQTSGVGFAPYNGDFTGFELKWGNLARGGPTPTSPVGPSYNDDITFGMLVGIQVPVDSVDFIEGTDWTLDQPIMVRWRLDGATVSGRFWRYGEVEPTYWQSTTGNDLLGASPLYLWFQSSAVPGDNIYIDQYEVVQGLACSGGGGVDSGAGKSCGFLDTFDRTETNGWGIVVPDEYVWTSDAYPGLQVNGGSGVMFHRNVGGQWEGTNARLGGDVTLWPENTQYIEGTFDFQPPPILPSFGAMDLRLCDACGTAGQNFIRFAYGTAESSGLSGRRLSTCNTATTGTAAFSWVGGQWYSVRVKVDPRGIYARVWIKGDPEPASWNLTIIPTAVPSALPVVTWDFLLVTEGFFTTASTVRIDNVCIVENDCCQSTGTCPTYTHEADPAFPPTLPIITDGQTSGYLSSLPAFNTSANPTHGGVSDQIRIDMSGGCVLDAISLAVSGGDESVYPIPSPPFSYQTLTLFGRDGDLIDRSYIGWQRTSPSTWRLSMADPANVGGPLIYRQDVSGTTVSATFSYSTDQVTITAGTTTETYALDGSIGRWSLVDFVNWWGNVSVGAISVNGTLSISSGGGSGPCADQTDSSPGTRICENLTRIDVPPNSSEEWAYYQTTYQMAFGSDEVWLDGLRVDSRDYTVVGLRDIIAFYDRLAVGGLDASDPSKVVHACYITAAIGVI